MLRNKIEKGITVIIILASILNVSPLLINTSATNLSAKSSRVSQSITSTKIINAKTYKLNIAGTSDTSAQFQKMINSFPSGASIKLPKGKYKFSSTC